MLNYDGSDYILDFGQHAGSKLEDVPQSYIRWLIDEGVPDKRPDLAAALREQGMSREGGRLLFPGANTAITASQSAWRAPGIYETNDARFHDPHRQSPRWISDADAFRYFGLDGSLLSAHGSSPASEDDLMLSTMSRSIEWMMLGGDTKTPKRWLYQVYACAKRLGSIPFERGTADEALKDFLAKIQTRHEEILASIGCDVCDD